MSHPKHSNHLIDKTKLYDCVCGSSRSEVRLEMIGLGQYKNIKLLVMGFAAVLLLSACNVELRVPVVEAKQLQQYTISGLPQLNNSSLAASLTVDDVLEFAINDKVMHTFVSDRYQQIPPFTFVAYPDDEITLRAKNLNSWTGCGIGDVYLLTSTKSYKLSEAQGDLVCFNNEIFYNEDYKLPTD